MLDTRERLTKHLYPSALDLAPEGVAALRIGHGDGLEWEIAGDVLTITVGGDVTSYALAGRTIGQLGSDLAAAAIEIRYSNPDVVARSAASLVAGKGDNTRDTLVAFQSNLWALLDAYGVEIRDAELNLEAALEQLQLNTAEDEFLDFWGEFFAAPRLGGEDDTAYRARMAAEVLRPRSNRYAIQNTVRDLTGAIVSLREPWKEIFTLNASALSDTHAFQDGSFFTWNVFQPIFHSGVTLEERARILEIIDRNRPAGSVMVGATAQPPIAYADANLAPQGGLSLQMVLNSGQMHYQFGVLSSSLALSDGIEDIGSAFQWTLSGNLVMTFGAEPLTLFAKEAWDSRTWGSSKWVKASISMVVTQSLV